MNKKNLSEILLNAISITLGICLFLWAEKVTNVVSICLGCLAIIYSLITIYNYFKSDNRITVDTLRFIWSIVVLVVGFILIFRVDFLKELISFIVGVYIVLNSLLQLQEILIIKRDSEDKLQNPIILSLIQMLIGVLCIVGKFIVPDIIIKFIGIMLVIYGVINIVNTIIIKKN